MGNSANNLLRFALASQASYSLFDSGRPAREALQESGKGDFTSSETARFLGEISDPFGPAQQGIQIRHHQSNELSGFSASVLFDRSLNKHVLAIRGTQGLADIAEDIGRIGLQGFAGDQLVSLYRYYKRLTTPTGESVQYSSGEKSLLLALRLGISANPAAIVLARPAMGGALFAQLALDKGELPLSGTGPRVLQPGEPLIVTGHSLGGHLALLFGRFFPEVTEHVYAYNAPGINALGELALRAVGIPPSPPSLVTNVSAVMGDEAISRIWSKPGENVGIATEPGSILHQHSIVPLTDTLALYDAFAKLSPNFAVTDISGVLSAASPYSEDSLEVTLDALGMLLGTGSSSTLIARTGSDRAERDDYFQKLYRVLDARDSGRDYQIVSLAGKSAHDLAAMAASNVGVRYALSELNAFAAMNSDESEADDLYSSQWLSSRSELLAVKLDSNSVERPFGLSGTTDNVLFRDIDMEYRYSTLNGVQGNLALPIAAMADRGRIQAFLGDVAYSRTVVFGSESLNDELLGLAGGDRLFGGGGNDRLNGAGGDDYLEGGGGADTLIGGDGDDTLAGGEGADLLAGNVGQDSYVFAAVLDGDTIVDRDGSIHAGSVLLTGGFGERDSGIFRSSDGQFTYQFNGDLAAEGTLLINDVLRIESFRNGDLGIQLSEGREPGATVPVAEFELLGDFIYDPDLHIGDLYGNPVPEMRIAFVPGLADEWYSYPGTPGSTHFASGGGNDIVEDRAGGDDHLELGSGDDAGQGGLGNDVVEGGAGRDLLLGGLGDDTLIASSLATMQQDLDDQAISLPWEDGELLSGGDGDDRIFGNASSNQIAGGAGDDWIFGGAGDDVIGSDSSLNGNLVPWSPINPPDFGVSVAFVVSGGDAGADFVDAGAGNDTINAGDGDDFVLGGTGDDQINLGLGKDTAYAGDGNDAVFTGDDADGDFVDAGAGNDQVTAREGDDILVGGDGDDLIVSGFGNDLLIGGAGNDVLLAEGGNSTFDGGPGDDAMGSSFFEDQVLYFRFGHGYDHDWGGFSGGTMILEMAGDVSPAEVTVSAYERTFSTAVDGTIVDIRLPGVEFAIGNGDDSFFLIPSPEEAVVSTWRVEFSDGTVWDEAYVDSLLASPEEPEDFPLAGSDEADVVYGTAGTDTLSGGTGDDLLVGDAGDDAYLYAEGDGFDRIEDLDATPGNTDVLQFAEGIDADDVGVFAIENDYVLETDSGGVRLMGGRTTEGAVEHVDFADGTRWTLADLEARAEVLPANRAPEMLESFGSVSTDPGNRVEFSLPGDAVSDPDRFDAVSLYAITADGERLPGWLQFDAASRTLAGTPGQADAGVHELLFIAADGSGAAAAGSFTIEVGASAPPPEPAAPAVQAVAESSPSSPQLPAVESAVADVAPSPLPTAPAPRENAFGTVASVNAGLEAPHVFMESAEPAFRDIQHRLDVLVQTGRTNLGERYAEAIREFEERRLEREEVPPPPPPTEEEIEAWNSAMHSWHDRHQGFAETEFGGGDGAWGMGWGLNGPGVRRLEDQGIELAGIGLNSRLSGVASMPTLREGLRDLR